MAKRLIVLGAGGYGRTVADLAEQLDMRLLLLLMINLLVLNFPLFILISTLIQSS